MRSHTYRMELSLGLVLWVLAFAALFVTVILGAILSYHWLRFSMNTVVSTAAIGVFAAVSGVLLVVMFGAAAAFTL